MLSQTGDLDEIISLESDKESFFSRDAVIATEEQDLDLFIKHLKNSPTKRGNAK